MCSFAIVGLAVGLAGTVMQAAGQQQQANAQAAQANYQMQVAHNNTITARQLAKDAVLRGDAAVADQQRKNAQRRGMVAATMAANGVDIGSGSPLDAIGDTAAMGHMDALTVYSTYDRERMSHAAQAGNFSAEAQLAAMRRDEARRAGRIGVATTLIGGFGNALTGLGKLT